MFDNNEVLGDGILYYADKNGTYNKLGKISEVASNTFTDDIDASNNPIIFPCAINASFDITVPFRQHKRRNKQILNAIMLSRRSRTRKD